MTLHLSLYPRGREREEDDRRRPKRTDPDTYTGNVYDHDYRIVILVLSVQSVGVVEHSTASEASKFTKEE